MAEVAWEVRSYRFEDVELKTGKGKPPERPLVAPRWPKEGAIGFQEAIFST